MSLKEKVNSFLPHIGMRKVKSLIAIALSFLVWQIIRIFFPQTEIHPVFMYIYSMVEIRDSSEKTIKFGKLRIKAMVVGFLTGLSFLVLNENFVIPVESGYLRAIAGLVLILVGVLITLVIAEKSGCKTFCGIAALIFIIFLVSHTEDENVYVYATLRAVQTVLGVLIAWLVNVIMFPYSGKEENK